METQTTESQPADRQKLDSPISEFNTQMGIFLFISTAISLLLIFLTLYGFFDRWTKLPTPPIKPVKFQGVRRYFYQADPFILAEDGKTYTCVKNNPDGNDSTISCTWEVGEPEDINPLKPCRQGGIKFSAMKRTYHGIIDCFDTEMYGEFIGAPEVTYLIDSEGEVWLWAEENKGYTIIFLGGGIILGLLAGFVLSLPGVYLITRLRKPQVEQIRMLVGWEIHKIRWGARLLSLASLLYFSFEILVNRRSIPPQNFDEFLVIFSLSGAWIGLILAWHWEITGAIIVFIAAFAFIIRLTSGTAPSSGSMNAYDLLTLLLPYFPAVFFLASGLLTRSRKTKRIENHT